MHLTPTNIEDWLAQRPKARVTQDDYLRGFALANPEWAREGDFRARVFHALKNLEVAQKLRLPKDLKHYDNLGSPRLPMYVMLTREQPAARESAPKDVVWVPELAFAAKKTNPAQLKKLATINQFLIEQRAQLQECIPYRERSLQIFGDEKALDRVLVAGKLFGELDLAAIAALEPEAPLVIDNKSFAARGAPILLVENHHTYWSCVQWNHRASVYAAVAYGVGNAILNAPLGLIKAADAAGASCIEYFGDLDPKGVEIATQLSARLQERGGPAVRPAAMLYEIAVRDGVRRPMTEKKKAYNGDPLAWLRSLAPAVVELFESAHWIPQESVSLDRLRALTAASAVAA
ncbi:DUF2399 domain-containing protein [Paraburkholderia sp. UCT31]|uniref:DUF2399 domain-containing protein n=1 Tax=Paraburkholderia sp. UCT31 TaxID=2615209 RepID=UPI0016550DB9|nr:DUF2399 domain-containing protein [Paraburkholderia sp. UCT31]